MLVVFAIPFYKEASAYYLDAILRIEGARLAIITQDPEEAFPWDLRQRWDGHWRVPDALDPEHLAWAAEGLAKHLGPIHRLLAVNEQTQIPAAIVRERLGIEGMDVRTARLFRDKGRMKERFRECGVPCARHCRATNSQEALEFVDKVGFPVCVKPVDGAAAQSTYRLENTEMLQEVLRASAPCEERPLQIEEFVTGDEHSFETISLEGKRVWHSLTRYLPTPLDVLRNPWIQWRIVLPKEIDFPVYDDIRNTAQSALEALGMRTGLSHLEWFRRPDGTIAVGEVAGRPPGAQIVTMMNRAHDFDIFTEWIRLMVLGEFNPPRERRYAAGVVFLRGLGAGKVQSVHGLHVLEELSPMVTDVKIPQRGQPAGTTYEGEGYVLIRHAETRAVEEGLQRIIDTVRVELVS